MKRGTEDLDFFIGDEALAAASGPGISKLEIPKNGKSIETDEYRLWYSLPYKAWTDRELGAH